MKTFICGPLHKSVYNERRRGTGSERSVPLWVLLKDLDPFFLIDPHFMCTTESFFRRTGHPRHASDVPTAKGTSGVSG